jgi:hypothetical protein
VLECGEHQSVLPSVLEWHCILRKGGGELTAGEMTGGTVAGGTIAGEGAGVVDIKGIQPLFIMDKHAHADVDGVLDHADEVPLGGAATAVLDHALSLTVIAAKKHATEICFAVYSLRISSLRISHSSTHSPSIASAGVAATNSIVSSPAPTPPPPTSRWFQLTDANTSPELHRSGGTLSMVPTQSFSRHRLEGAGVPAGSTEEWQDRRCMVFVAGGWDKAAKGFCQVGTPLARPSAAGVCTRGGTTAPSVRNTACVLSVNCPGDSWHCWPVRQQAETTEKGPADGKREVGGTSEGKAAQRQEALQKAPHGRKFTRTTGPPVCHFVSYKAPQSIGGAVGKKTAQPNCRSERPLLSWAALCSVV